MSNRKLVLLKVKTGQRLIAISDEGRFFKAAANTFEDLLKMQLSKIKAMVEGKLGLEVEGVVCAPIDGTVELWGAGVTYMRSRDARKAESETPDLYQKVYEAERPELFFKSTALRTRGTGEMIGIRYDAELSVPEPEVAIFINQYKEIIGYSICNDVTARSIEGENALYLTQSKIYVGSTALGPDITPIWSAPEPYKMTIKARILRGTEIPWQAETSLGQLNRTLEDLVDYLFRCQEFPSGVVLSSGTGIVPPFEVSLHDGDVVEIVVEGVGTLRNPVEVITINSK